MLRVKTYADTIKYLRPDQLYSQIARRFKSKRKPVINKVPAHREIHLLIPELDLDEAYIRRFVPEDIPAGKIHLLNDTYDLAFNDVNKAKMSPLTWYNLQYFEYAIALACIYRKTKDQRYVDSFERAYSDFLAADLPYASYVISLQIPNVMIALEIFDNAVSTKTRDLIHAEIYRQYKYLSSHLETYLLGNHYFENLKALIIASYYFGDDRECRKYIEKLKIQTKEQILEDGMHFELSPMYHKIILEDLLRVHCIKDFGISEWICPVIQKMTDALAALENGISRTPLFNDSGDNVAKTAKALLEAANVRCHITPQPTAALEEAKYYRLESNGAVLLVDGGRIGPDYMPGHGHSDCLSFELFIHGIPVAVNSGTYQYQGEQRKYFRSARAHNTVTMDDHEQSQCWGEHRVAKRIRNVKSHSDGRTFRGEYENYYGQRHKRIIQLENDRVSVTDETQGAHEVKSYLRIPGCFTLSEDLEVKDMNGSRLCRIQPQNCEARIISEGDMTQYAPEFGMLEKCCCIEFFWKEDGCSHGYQILL